MSFVALPVNMDRPRYYSESSSSSSSFFDDSQLASMVESEPKKNSPPVESQLTQDVEAAQLTPPRAILELDLPPPPTLLEQLLTKKEKLTEQFLNQVLAGQRRDGACGTSADMSHQHRIETAEKKLAEVSMILAHKHKSMISDVVAQQESKLLNRRYGRIKAKPKSDVDLSKNYRKCFDAFVNSEDCVSFRAPHKQLLKNIKIRDAFTLTFFSMNTTKRSENDNILQLIVCGETSCGKSLLFEGPVQEVSHTVTQDSGVGRFLNLNAKSTCLIRDCNINCLVKGRDVDKWKCLARGEPITTKVHSKTNVIPPMYHLVTSNLKLNDHKFEKRAKNSLSFSTEAKSDIERNKKLTDQDIAAVRNRYIECYVRQRPTIAADDLPTSGNFNQRHCIMGLFRRVISILTTYTKEDFFSDYLYLYPICGLAKKLYMMPENCHDPLKRSILHLMDIYELDLEQRKMCWEDDDY